MLSKEAVSNLEDSANKLILEANDSKCLKDLKVRLFGKKGELTLLLKELKNVAPEDKKFLGGLINQTKKKLEDLYSSKEKSLQNQERNKKLQSEWIVTSIHSD